MDEITQDELADMISDKISKIDGLANKNRIDSIKEFINELKTDYQKYLNKKKKYTSIKNILMTVDIAFGSILTICGIILEVVSMGASSVVSLAMSGVGVFVVSTLPLSMKISDKLESKNRNFTILSQNKINKVKIIFSKALEDDYISQEEFETVMECRKEYLESKRILKTKNKKEIDSIFKDYDKIEMKGFKMLNTEKSEEDKEMKEIEILKKTLEKEMKKKAITEVKKEMLEKQKEDLKKKMGYPSD